MPRVMWGRTDGEQPKQLKRKVKLVTTSKIISQGINILDDVNNFSTLVQSVPRIIIFLEQNYKNLQGESKKTLAIEIFNAIVNKLPPKEQELANDFAQALSGIIDATVTLANSDLFKKNKCCRPK